MSSGLYNPLSVENIAESLLNKVLETPCGALPPPTAFYGGGVYVIYYHGPFPSYRAVAVANTTECVKPIYAGKAVPKGGRIGAAVENLSGQELYGRLVEHAQSIQAAENLSLSDFTCRYLPVEHLFIALAEHTLINLYKPVWNYFGGFGNHDPGKGRYNQKRSAWDTVHPGREWAKRLQDNKNGATYWEAKFRDHIAKAERGGVQPIPLDEDTPTELNPEADE